MLTHQRKKVQIVRIVVDSVALGSFGDHFDAIGHRGQFHYSLNGDFGANHCRFERYFEHLVQFVTIMTANSPAIAKFEFFQQTAKSIPRQPNVLSCKFN